ncbi:MAG: hypothetical protein AAB225_24265 [Acidobacteriota bacterium]
MKYRHRVLAMLFLLSIITYIDRVCISVAGPAMQKDLDIPPEMWGWVVGVFAISYPRQTTLWRRGRSATRPVTATRH